MASNQVTPSEPKPEVVEKVYKYFDFETFAEVKELVKVPFTPASDFAGAVARLDNDAKRILDALNAALKRAVFGEARREVAKKGASKKVVLDLIRPMRVMLPFSAIADRKEQTKALLALVKSTSALMDSIRATSLAAAEVDTDEEGGEEEE